MGLEILPVADGLPFHDGAVTFPYHGFHELRKRIAATVGIDLEAMDGFDGTAEWPSTEDEPLVPFLRHSDCDGELVGSECKAIAERLRAVTEATFPRSSDLDLEVGSENEWLREKGLALADACDGVLRGEYERLVFM